MPSTAGDKGQANPVCTPSSWLRKTQRLSPRRPRLTYRSRQTCYQNLPYTRRFRNQAESKRAENGKHAECVVRLSSPRPGLVSR